MITYKPELEKYTYTEDESKLVFTPIHSSELWDVHSEKNTHRENWLKSIVAVSEHLIDSKNIDGAENIHKKEAEEKQNFLVWLWDNSDNFSQFMTDLLSGDIKKNSELIVK